MLKKHLFTLSLGITAMAIQASAVQAEPVDYAVDEGHAYVVFFADHLGFSRFPGTFNTINGTISFDEANPENSSVSVSFPANTVDMNHDVLNEKLLGENFFQVEQYPEISFESNSIEVTGENTGVVTGNLTLLGVTKEVALNTTFNKKAYNQHAQGMTVGFSAEGTLNRSDFGMDYLLPGIGDDVPFRIEIEGVNKDIPAPENQDQ